MKDLLEDTDAGGLVFAIPPQALRPSEVDPEVWSILERINRSGWVMAQHSCAGHWTEDGEEWTATPYLELLCHVDHLPRLARIVAGAIVAARTDAEIADAGFLVRPKSASWWIVEVHYGGDDVEGPRPVAAERGLAMLSDISQRL